MYGGGVDPGEIDRSLPVRPSALRGQLRFWWRLLNGSGQTSQQLFSDESALWGGISSRGPQASQVSLHVKTASVGDGELVAKSRIANFPHYALILEPKADPILLKSGYKFELTICFERTVQRKQRAQVLEALRWWASFAGVGARTRRGLGAVKVVHSNTGLKPVSAEEVERRGGKMALLSPGNDALKAWTTAVNALRRFRQEQGIGRKAGPGRSHWPEPDTIRDVTGQSARNHPPVHPAKGYYPRAAFGMPLVFHFKQSRDPNDGRDPEDMVLTPDGHNRMASPLILRPYHDGRQYRPLALLLPGWEAAGKRVRHRRPRRESSHLVAGRPRSACEVVVADQTYERTRHRRPVGVHALFPEWMTRRPRWSAFSSLSLSDRCRA